jgi:hypothetical protein
MTATTKATINSSYFSLLLCVFPQEMGGNVPVML